MTALYSLLILAVAIFALLRGFKKGLTRQTSDVLAVCFAIVSVHVLLTAIEPAIATWIPERSYHALLVFTCENVTAAIIYTVVFFIVKLPTMVLCKAMTMFFPSGILDKIAGSLFAMFKWLIWTSIMLNLLACIGSDSSLLRDASATDGNMVQGTMLLAPNLFGITDAEELAHYYQLKEAAKIS